MSETAAYSGTPLAKKLGIKDGFLVGLVNEPDYYFSLFTEFPDNIQWDRHPDQTGYDMIHLFVTGREIYSNQLRQAKNQIKKSGMIWISWPKKTSGIITDLTENSIREIALDTGLVDVKVCAVNEKWSGLKLVYRLKDR